VVNCTTPANFFHVLRRQLHRDIRLPLIVFTPKSLLRHPECTSSLADFTEGRFLEVIEDKYIEDPSKVKRVLLCSGKIYYELNAVRKEKKIDDISILRLEQVYPFPEKQIKEILQRYPENVELVWVQEEPLNMGAALFVKQQIGCTLRVISRPSSGVTAEGLTAQHKVHQAVIMDKALNLIQD